MKRFTLSLFAIFLIATLYGCGPKGDPKETLESYYTNVINANYDAAYALLSEADRKATSKDDFALFMRMNAELYKLNATEVKGAEKSGETVVFEVTEKQHSYTEEKDKSHTYKRSVVAENGEWKVFADKTYGDSIAGQMVRIGQLHLNGIGEKKENPNEAAIWFNKALQRDSAHNDANFGLALAYMKLGRFQESIDAAKKFVESETYNIKKSDGLNVLGVSYEAMRDVAKAKEAYQKAVESNPGNEYAKTNLSRYK
ncbi:tetratricopeptide repeat protein [Brevibacillus sp. NPDC003359]|uniref:tetratricopeptide repeat protein n=1 Tax=unclassified Brevibacillus TaxID=2684853 RepID=UPI0036A7CF75